MLNVSEKKPRMLCTRLYLTILSVVLSNREIAEANWTTEIISELSQSLMTIRNTPCAVITYPDDFPPQEVHNVIQELQRNKRSRFQMMRAISLELISQNLMDDCSHTLYIVMTWLTGTKREFRQMMDGQDGPFVESTWLILQALGETREDFIEDTDLPFVQRLIMTGPGETHLVMREVWRVGPGYPLRSTHYASWSLKTGLTCKRRQCLYHHRNDLEGYPMRAATKEDMPLSKLKQLEDGSLGLDGYFGGVYYEILNRINATAVVMQATENVTGSATDGLWNGLIGMLQREEIDIAVGPLSVQHISLQVVNFARPLLRTNYQVFFKQSGNVIEWDAFMKPFGQFVWRLILLTVIVGAIFLWLFYRIGAKIDQEDDLYLWEYNMINSFFSFFKAFCHQGTDLMPSSLSCRVLYLTGYITYAILQTAYSGALISKLTTQEPLRPFDSLESFLKDGSYKLTAIGASTDYSYFSQATDSTLKNIYERQMLRQNLPTGKEEGLMAVCGGERTALFITFAVTQISARQISANNKCPILFFKNPLGIVSLSIGFRKRLPFISLITQEVQVMAEIGVLKRLRNRAWPLYQPTNSGGVTSQVEVQQVAQIHAIYLGGIALSLIILMLEILHSAYPVTNKYRRIMRKCHLSWDNITAVIFFMQATAIIASIFIAMI